MTTGEGMQPGCLMKILEAERWLRGTNFHEVAFLRRQGGRTAGVPHPGGSEDGKARCMRRARRTWLPSKGVSPLLKATLPTCALNRCRSSLLQHAPRFSPTARGLGPTCHASPSRREEAKLPRARGACNHPAVTSTPPLSPRPAGERADSHAGGMQPRQVGAPLRLPTHPVWGPTPTRHATGAPVATCKQLHRHSHHYHASSTAEPVPQLEATLRTTQQGQPGVMVNAAKNGPAVMAVAGGQIGRAHV